MRQLSERRLVENEALFRGANEEIEQAAEEFYSHSERDKTLIEFYCECSDQICHDKILMTPQRYKEVHIDRKEFIVKPGHEISKVEAVIEKGERYLIVRKYLMPKSQPASG